MTRSSDDEIITKLKVRDRAGAWMVVTLMGLLGILAALFAAALFTGNAALLKNKDTQNAAGHDD